VSGQYPRLYQAVLDMVPEVALVTQHARGVARKAGLRRGTGTVETAVVSDYVGKAEQPLARQWLIDLTDCTQARFYSGSSVPIYLFRSDNLSSEALDPGDYEPFMDGTSAQFSCEASDTPEWRELWDSTPQRLTISTSASQPEMNTGALDGAFSVLLQVV